MSKNLVKDENYITIQGWMVTRLKLSGNELIIYALIYGFSQIDDHNFHGSLQYISNWTNISKNSCISNLKKLIDKNLIIKKEKEINGLKFCEYSTNLNSIQETCILIQETLTNNIDNNIEKDINNINIINSENLEKPKKELSDKQKKAIERDNILKEFIKDEDEDIQKALKDYVNIRKKKGLDAKQLQIILEDFEKAYKNKSKTAILEQIRKATAGGWMQLVYTSTFTGTPKTSYGSKPSFDNTANHVISIGKIKDEIFKTLTRYEKIQYLEKLPVADMTELQREFFNENCLAKDENGNNLEF